MNGETRNAKRETRIEEVMNQPNGGSVLNVGGASAPRPKATSSVIRVGALRPLPHSATSQSAGSLFRRATEKQSRPFAFASAHSAIRTPQSAFTLVELMAVIAVVGLLVAVSIPAFRGMGGASQVANAGRQFNNALMAARQYAVARGVNVRVVVACEDTVRGASNDEEKAMNCSAYAIMWQSNSLTWQVTLQSPAQPNVPQGQGLWYYLQPWRMLPNGVVFDPARQELQSSDGRITLPPTTIFQGRQATRMNQAAATRDLIPFPNDLGRVPTSVAFVQFKPTGQPTVSGSVRLVAGFVETDGDLVVRGRNTPTSAQGSDDPAAANSVVLQWDEISGRIQWVQPGR